MMGYLESFVNLKGTVRGIIPLMEALTALARPRARTATLNIISREGVTGSARRGKVRNDESIQNVLLLYFFVPASASSHNPFDNAQQQMNMNPIRQELIYARDNKKLSLDEYV